MLEALKSERLKKLKALREGGIDPFAARVSRTHTIEEVHKHFETLAGKQEHVSVVGRVKSIRDQGGILFVDIADATGSIQLILAKTALETFSMLRDTTDIGDFVETSGTLTKTKRGEESLQVNAFRVVTKSLRPVPSDWYAVEEIETRLRKRYLDLLGHTDTRELFVKKSRFWSAAREHLVDAGFLEVETPVLEAVPGGAEAAPFATHLNALDIDLYLRISLELPLKRLVIGGYERVFEIGRIFRNEGIDAEHLQDYTQMECYAAYMDYRELMVFVEGMFKKIIEATLGSLKSTWNGEAIDWGKKWEVVDYFEIFKEKVGLDLAVATRDDLEERAREANLKLEPNLGKGRLIDLLFKKFARSSLVQPVFLIDPPVEIEPLAKRSDQNPKRVERFQVVACGTELGKGFSELNDPVDQRERFEEQMKLREAGDEEAQRLDEDFLEALEYGMPPTAGFGFSERLFAVLVGKPVRETVFFPLMRPKDSK